LILGKIDTGSKQIIHLYNHAWAEWNLQQSLQVESELSSEFEFIARASDSLLQLKGKLGSFLALTELQFQYKKDIPERLMAYAALARHKYKLDVFVTVVYFLPPGEDVTIANAYHNDFMGQTAHQDFRVISLWELDAKQVLAFNNPVLLPFVPLMRGGNTAKMVETCAERIRQQPENAADLEALLALLAGYVLDTKLVNQMLRWEMQLVQQSPILQELLVERFQKGRDKGREEGRRLELLKLLYKILTFRFGVVATKPFEERLKPLDLPSLERLEDEAFTVQTLADFETRLAQKLLDK